MAKANLARMSVDDLLELRDDIAAVRKAKELETQLSRLGGKIGLRKTAQRSPLKGRRVAVKFRDKSGNTWAGRGARPVCATKSRPAQSCKILQSTRNWLFGGRAKSAEGRNAEYCVFQLKFRGSPETTIFRQTAVFFSIMPPSGP
jgi:hypothetical protein